MSIRHFFNWLKARFYRRIMLPDVCVKETGTQKGRGVYGLRDFAEGEIVETCPVMVITTLSANLPMDLRKIIFHWKTNETAPQLTQHALALGYGSLYNHGDLSNLRYERDRSASMIRFIAERRIAAGEELTINYNSEEGATTAEDNRWFKDKKIKVVTD